MHRYETDSNCPSASADEARERTGRRLFLIFAGILLAMFVSAVLSTMAEAQTVPGTMTLRWTLPTTGCDRGVSPPVCGKPLTGEHALLAVHVWISTSPITVDPSTGAPAGAPTLTLAAGATTATHTMTVNAGQTLYARVSTRNASGDGELSNQVSKVVTLPIKPGAPTSVTIELTIAP